MSDTVFDFYFPWFGNFSLSVSVSLSPSHMKSVMVKLIDMSVRSLITITELYNQKLTANDQSNKRFMLK